MRRRDQRQPFRSRRTYRAELQVQFVRPDLDFNVGRDFVKSCDVPMLGNDAYHPKVTSREIAGLAPNTTLVEQWKSPAKDGTVQKVIEFLQANTPS